MIGTTFYLKTVPIFLIRCVLLLYQFRQLCVLTCSDGCVSHPEFPLVEVLLFLGHLIILLVCDCWNLVTPLISATYKRPMPGEITLILRAYLVKLIDIVNVRCPICQLFFFAIAPIPVNVAVRLAYSPFGALSCNELITAFPS